MMHSKITDSNFSIGIVGAGPAGTLCAYLLASKGVSVTLFDRAPHLKRKVCGEYLCPKGIELLAQLNILDLSCQGFEELQGMVLVSPNNIVVATDFPQPVKKEYGLSINRHVFDQRLLNLAIKNGACYKPNWILNSLEQTADQKWKINNGESEEVFDLLIAADGRQSKIGHFLGHIHELNTKRAALHCFLPRNKFLGQRRGEMHIFADGSYCGLNPISDQEVNFSVVIDSEILKHQKPEEIIEHKIHSSLRLSQQFELKNSEKIKINKVTCLKNKNFFIAGSNLAYVGDAAGFIDPLTGEGIYNALLSSKLLVDCLLKEKNISTALLQYKNQKNRIRLQKEILNQFFQFLIKHPFLVNVVAKFLSGRKARGDFFIGIIGNIYDPFRGLLKMFLA